MQVIIYDCFDVFNCFVHAVLVPAPKLHVKVRRWNVPAPLALMAVIADLVVPVSSLPLERQRVPYCPPVYDQCLCGVSPILIGGGRGGIGSYFPRVSSENSRSPKSERIVSFSRVFWNR